MFLGYSLEVHSGCGFSLLTDMVGLACVSGTACHPRVDNGIDLDAALYLWPIYEWLSLSMDISQICFIRLQA